MKTYCHNDTVSKLLESDELQSPKITNIGEAIDLSNNLDRNIFLVDDVDDDTANSLNIIIRFWNRLDDELELEPQKRDPIKLYINSYGGSLTAGYAIIDTIKLSKTPIYTINIGVAYSAAFEIFIAGHKRFAYPTSSFLFHEGAIDVSGDANKFRNYAEFYQVQLNQAKTHVLASTKITEDEYTKHQKDDWWFTAEEAIQYGICDEIETELR